MLCVIFLSGSYIALRGHLGLLLFTLESNPLRLSMADDASTVGTETDAPASDRGLSSRLLAAVERTGNALPEPVTLFFIFIGLTMLVSLIVSALGVSVEHPRTGEMIAVESLFSGENIQRLFTDMADTFADFPPLGLVLVVMLGIGVADKSGFIGAALGSFMRAVPNALLTMAIVFTGIMSNMAVDAGYVVVIPLGALLFYGAGRHPLAGLAAAFAGVSAGFSANVLPSALDVLLASFTEPAAQIMAPDYAVTALANYYFIAALVPVFVFAGWIVTDYVVEPYLGDYEPPEDLDDDVDTSEESSALEKKGLRWGALSMLAIVAAASLLVIPENGALRGPEGGFEPAYEAIVGLMVVIFFVPGLVYGIVTKQITEDKDVTDMMSETMSDLGVYIVLAFAAAHFVAMFGWSNLDMVVAITGAGVLETLESSIGLSGIPLIIVFILVSAFINLFVGSASAKWAIMGPTFVPMLMLMGYSPELTQAAYRVGDSFTNILTPLLPYFPLIIVFAQRYDKKAGIGSIVAVMLPYSIVFGIVSTLVLAIWIFFGIPLGPEAPLFIDTP